MPNWLLLFTLLNIHSAWCQEYSYFWHVSDFHYDPRYGSLAAQQTADQPGDQLPRDYFLGDYDPGCWAELRGEFGDYNCDAPAALIESATNFMREFDPPALGLDIAKDKINFIIWTGDDTSHANDTYFDPDMVLAANQFVAQALSEVGLDVFAVLGNHDIHPKNQMPVENGFYTSVADIWRSSLAAGRPHLYPYLEEFAAAAGYYAVGGSGSSSSSSPLPWRLIGLNSNLWYKSNGFTQDLADPADQFRWLRDQLSSAREAGERVLLFSHIAPGKFERFYQHMAEVDYSGFHWLADKFNELYLDLVAEFADVIEMQLLAHHHTDSFKIFRSEDGTPVGVGLLVPGVTPWNSTLAPETGANNPGLRLFKYEERSGRILDYYQFYLDLEKANEKGEASWELEYTMLEYYAIPDMSPVTMDNLLINIREDESMFNAYYAANTVQLEQADWTICDVNCRQYHFCAMSQLRYEDFELCLLQGLEDNIPEICII